MAYDRHHMIPLHAPTKVALPRGHVAAASTPVFVLFFFTAFALYGNRPSPEVGAGLVGAAFVVAWFGPGSRDPLLMRRLSTLAYFLPYTVGLGYLFQERLVWGPQHVRWLTVDRAVMADVLYMGALGLLALGVGQWSGYAGRQRKRPRTSRRESPDGTLALSAHLFLLAISIYLSWYGARGGYVFDIAYGSVSGGARSESINLNAAALAGHLLLLLLLLDAARGAQSRKLRRTKSVVAVAVMVYITTVLQLLRGDRQGLTLVVGAVVVYLLAQPKCKSERSIRGHLSHSPSWAALRRIAFPLALTLVAFIAIGGLRSTVAGGVANSGAIIEGVRRGYEQNPWTPILLTSVANSSHFVHGEGDLEMGTTYWHYLLSLTPGPLSEVLGFERPLERGQGPAWWARGIGLGGIHLSVVPYRNFGPAGLALILYVLGYALGKVEAAATRQSAGLWIRYLYVCIIAVAVRWFWYGDMYLVRALMLAVGWYVLYGRLVRSNRFGARPSRFRGPFPPGFKRLH